MVYEGFRLRSTEVDRGRPKSRKYLGHFRTSWWIWKLRLCQNWNMFMLHRSIWVSGADLIRLWNCWPRKGRISTIFHRKKSAEISICSPQQNEGIWLFWSSIDGCSQAYRIVMSKFAFSTETPSPPFAKANASISQPIFSYKKSSYFDPSSVNKSIFLIKSTPETHIDR